MDSGFPGLLALLPWGEQDLDAWVNVASASHCTLLDEAVLTQPLSPTSGPFHLVFLSRVSSRTHSTHRVQIYTTVWRHV